MIKTLKFGDKDVQFSTSFAWCFIYKNQFGTDPAKIFMPSIKKITRNDMEDMDMAVAIYEEMGFVGITQVAWAMAKLANKSIPDPLTWVQSFGDDFEALTLVTELIPDAIQSCFSSKNLETPPQKDPKEAPEAEKDPEK